MQGAVVNELGCLMMRVRLSTTLPERTLYRLRRTPLVQRMIVPVWRDLNAARRVFIVNCYISDTTLLTKILRQHHECSGFAP